MGVVSLIYLYVNVKLKRHDVNRHFANAAELILFLVFY